MLNQENIQSPIIQCRRNCFFFVMEVYPEKMMERLKSGEYKTIFRLISCIVIIGLTTIGRAAWEEEEETRKDISIVLILEEQFCTSELFKVIHDAVSLIILYRTMLLFQATSSSTIIMSDVQSILHSIINSGLILGGQNLSNRQTVFFLLVDPMDKNHKDLDKIDLEAPRLAQYMHKACQDTSKCGALGRHQTCSKERIQSSIKHDRTQSSFTTHSQLIVSRKLFGWKLEKSFTRKFLRHLVFLQRSLWNKTGWRNWVQKLLNDQMEKLFNNPKVPNQANQIQTQIMMERWHPLFAVTEVTRKVQDIHVHLMTARTSTLETKQIMIEKGHPLFAVT